MKALCSTLCYFALGPVDGIIWMGTVPLSLRNPGVGSNGVCAFCILQMSQASSIHLHSEQLARKYKGLSLSLLFVPE